MGANQGGVEHEIFVAGLAAERLEGAMHRCSFYDNKDVGKKFSAMLEMGASKPWPDALDAFTGQREISGDAVIAYFAPLQAWLKEQNQGESCGW